MPTTTLTRLSGLFLACLLAFTSMPLMAAVYKCNHNGQVVYADAPCGKTEQPMKTQVSVVSPFAAPKAPASQPWSVKGMLSSVGLDTTGGLIAALLFGIPLSFIIVFFLTRKSES